MQRNANIEQTSEINKDFFVISQRVLEEFEKFMTPDPWRYRNRR